VETLSSVRLLHSWLNAPIYVYSVTPSSCTGTYVVSKHVKYQTKDTFEFSLNYLYFLERSSCVDLKSTSRSITTTVHLWSLKKLKRVSMLLDLRIHKWLTKLSMKYNEMKYNFHEIKYNAETWTKGTVHANVEKSWKLVLQLRKNSHKQYWVKQMWLPKIMPTLWSLQNKCTITTRSIK